MQELEPELRSDLPVVERRLLLVSVFAAVVAGLLAVLPLHTDSFDRYHLTREALLLVFCVPIVASLRTARFDRIDAWALAFSAASVVSATVAENAWAASRAVALTVAATVLFMGVRRLTPRSRRTLRLAALALVAVVALIALAESHGIVTGLSGRGRAPGSLMGQRNAVAHVAILALPLALAGQASFATIRGRASAIAVLVLTAAIVVSRCRGAYLALPIVVAVGLWRAPRRSAVGLALVAGVALGLLPNRLEWRSRSPYADSLSSIVDLGNPSVHGRLTQWRRTLSMIAEHPLLGVGPGNWEAEYPRYVHAGDAGFSEAVARPTQRLLNQDVLAVVAERGLLGLGLVLGFASVLMLQIRRCASESERRSMLATCAGLVVLGAFDSVLQLATPLVLAAVTFGSAVPARADAPRATNVHRWALASALAAALAVSAAWELRSLYALALVSSPKADAAALAHAARLAPDRFELQLDLAQVHASAGRCDEARPYIVRALALLPNHPMTRAVAARCVAQHSAREVLHPDQSARALQGHAAERAVRRVAVGAADGHGPHACVPGSRAAGVLGCSDDERCVGEVAILIEARIAVDRAQRSGHGRHEGADARAGRAEDLL